MCRHFLRLRDLLHRRTARAASAGLLLLMLVPLGAGSAIGWRGDFESGNFSQWDYGVQAKDSSRYTIVTSVAGSPVRQGRYAARYEVRPGDNNVAGSGSGERTEALISGAPTGAGEGVEQYWAWSTFFPSDFDSPMGGWNVFTQFHHTGSTGQSNIHFEVRDKTTLGLRVLGGDANAAIRQDFTLAQLQRGKWYDFVFHVKWSSSGSGFVEVWVDGSRVVAQTSTPTLYAGQGVYLKQGFYRAAYDQTTVLYHDGMRRGSSYDEVAADFPSGGSTTSGSTSLSAPVNTAPPSVSGAAIEGGQLSASAGSWSNSPTTHAYQWQSSLDAGASWSSVSGATLSTFNNTSTFTKRLIRVLVTAANSGGSTTAPSAAVGPVTAPLATTASAPANTGLPAISGQLVAGSTLTASSGTWSNQPTGYGYQWQSSTDGTSWAPISGATSASLALTSTHAGTQLRVAVTATNTGGTAVALSPARGPVAAAPAPAPPAPTNTAAPAVSGVLEAGSTLTASTGTWANQPTGYGYQWQTSADGASWTALAGATSATLALGSSHVGTQVRVAVTATNASGSGLAVSPGRGPVAAAPPPAPFSVVSSLNGSSLRAPVEWAATVSGRTVEKVEFLIDGKLEHTEWSAPYVYGGDGQVLNPSLLPNGKHTFVVKAFAADGTTVTDTDTLTVNVSKAGAR